MTYTFTPLPLPAGCRRLVPETKSLPSPHEIPPTPLGPGESYAGVYVPLLAEAVVRANKRRKAAGRPQLVQLQVGAGRGGAGRGGEAHV